MKSEKPKILNCPFCNHEAFVAKKAKNFYIVCGSYACGIKGVKTPILTNSIGAWNTRAEPWMAEAMPTKDHI